MKSPLVTVNTVALLLLTGMSDLESSTRLAVAGVIIVNLLLLIGKDALTKTPARIGARVSLIGYAGMVGAWLVLAIGCGIEYYNARCDAIVTPAIGACVVAALVSLPAGRLVGLFTTAQPTRTSSPRPTIKSR